MDSADQILEYSQRRCGPCEGGVTPMRPDEVEELLEGMPGWEYINGEIQKTFDFRNYYETISFVNAVAYMANRENHHPDLEVSYRKCVVRYSTHAIGGLSGNDFICAAKVETLLY